MVLAAILGYLIGSIPVAQLVGRRFGVDPTRNGDGNPGWWNMRGLVGERRAIVVAVGDTSKGVFAALIGIALWGPWWVAYIAVVFAMIGHAFPIFARFRGGKSVLTWAGGSLVLAPIAGVIALAIGFVAGLIGRRLAVFALVSTVTFPFFQALFDPRSHVALTGVLMTFIGLRFLGAYLVSRFDPAKSAPAADLPV